MPQGMVMIARGQSLMMMDHGGYDYFLMAVCIGGKASEGMASLWGWHPFGEGLGSLDSGYY